MNWMVSGGHLFNMYISVFSIVKLIFTPFMYQLRYTIFFIMLPGNSHMFYLINPIKSQLP